MDIEENFVGREEQIEEYKEFSTAEPPPWMLTITGIAGTGKSTLLRKFLSKESEEVGTILLDFENSKEILENPLALLKFLVEKVQGYCSSEAVANFHKKLAESNDAITKTIEYVDKALTLQISKVEEASIPTSSIKTELEEQKTINRNELERQHSTNVRDLATRLFYKILNSCSKERLIFIFDTCERLLEPMGEAVGVWLMDEVLPMLQIRFSRPCFVVFAGRELPTSKSINSSDQISYELPNLTEKDLQKYLKQAKVASPALLKNAFKMTHGHALCMSIIGALWKESNYQDEDEETVSTEFQDKFNERVAVDLIDERILLRIESPLKELIRFSALLREFSRPLLEAALTDIDKEKIPEWFEQLIGYSFIKPKEDFHFALHDLLREVLVPKLHKSDEQRVKEYHKRIRDFIEKEKGSRTAEWHYHNIAYDEVQGMVDWKADIEQAQHAHDETFVNILLQVVTDSTTILDLEESRILRDIMRQRYKSRLPTSEEREADIGNTLKEISRDPEATLDERSKAQGMLFMQQSAIAEEKLGTASNGYKEQPIVTPTPPPQK